MRRKDWNAALSPDVPEAWVLVVRPPCGGVPAKFVGSEWNSHGPSVPSVLSVYLEGNRNLLGHNVLCGLQQEGPLRPHCDARSSGLECGQQWLLVEGGVAPLPPPHCQLSISWQVPRRCLVLWVGALAQWHLCRKAWQPGTPTLSAGFSGQGGGPQSCVYISRLSLSKGFLCWPFP